MQHYHGYNFLLATAFMGKGKMKRIEWDRQMVGRNPFPRKGEEQMVSMITFLVSWCCSKILFSWEQRTLCVFNCQGLFWPQKAPNISLVVNCQGRTNKHSSKTLSVAVPLSQIRFLSFPYIGGIVPSRCKKGSQGGCFWINFSDENNRIYVAMLYLRTVYR